MWYSNLFRVPGQRRSNLGPLDRQGNIFCTMVPINWGCAGEGGRGVHLVEALRCKSEGRGFDFRLFLWDFSLT